MVRRGLNPMFEFSLDGGHQKRAHRVAYHDSQRHKQDRERDDIPDDNLRADRPASCKSSMAFISSRSLKTH